ncbi:MAG: hypothetical protein HQL65_18740 [Magnetococcales bacterium]|nr:hypothetical protein [Magnetococcales bacterium]
MQKNKTGRIVALLATIFLFSGPGVGQGQPGTSACNWFGLTLGYKEVEWNAILDHGQSDQAILKHCLTRYCGREPRMHHSMVYEIMPCDHRCLVLNRRYYQESCF